MKKENSNADDLFKDAFDGLEVNPTSNNWDKIRGELDLKASNQIKQKFDEYEVTPSSKNWDNIKDQLPYNLRLRRQLSRLSKIAAVLLIGMICTVSFNIWNQNNTIASLDASKTTDTEQLPTANTIDATNSVAVETEKAVNFVFDLKEKNNADDKEKEEEDIMALLQFILDDSDDLADAVDESILESLLRPVEELPMEGLVLVIPEDDATEEVVVSNVPLVVVSNVEQDLTIKIPLVVVEQNEIESMINLYDANASHGTSPQEKE